MKNKKELKKGYILMLITVIIWGMDNVLVKSLLNDTIPTTILIYLRFIFATLIVGIILKIENESYSKEIINSKYKKLITTMAILLSIFYVVLIIIADIFWGLYTMTYMKINQKVSAMRVNRDLGVVAIIIYTIILLITNQFRGLFRLGFSNILKIAVISALIDVGTIITYYVAIRIISGVKCSILSLASPIISFTLSYFYLGERIVLMQFGGCILLFVSSILLAMRDFIESKQKSENNKENNICDTNNYKYCFNKNMIGKMCNFL